MPSQDLMRAEQEASRLKPFGFSRTDVLRMAVTLGLDHVAAIPVPRRATTTKNGKESMK